MDPDRDLDKAVNAFYAALEENPDIEPDVGGCNEVNEDDGDGDLSCEYFITAI